MIIGTPKEIKNHEYRVGLTPESARDLAVHGHRVLVQTGAGAGIGAHDRYYVEAGAEIALTAEGIRVMTPGKFTKMVEAVEHVTFSGNRARRLGQEVLYITERCVIRSTDTGLVATEIMPGIDPARDIIAASQGRVTVAENATTMPLSLLTEGPMGWQP